CSEDRNLPCGAAGERRHVQTRGGGVAVQSRQGDVHSDLVVTAGEPAPAEFPLRAIQEHHLALSILARPFERAPAPLEAGVEDRLALPRQRRAGLRADVPSFRDELLLTLSSFDDRLAVECPASRLVGTEEPPLL